MIDEKEKFEIAINKATGLDLSLGEMQMEYGADGFSKGKISFFMSLDKDKTIELCKIFGINSPATTVVFTGTMGFSGYQN